MTTISPTTNQDQHPHLLSPTEALIHYCNYVLTEELEELQKIEYNNKGRKYKFINNQFQRIRQEDKHLIIYPEQPQLKISFYSAFSILYQINDLLIQNPEFCCTILSIALDLEKNQWFEEQNSSIIHFKNCKIDPRTLKDEADTYILKHPITEKHKKWGINLLICSKLNFLHTDHHIGTKLEGEMMIHHLTEYFGDDSLSSIDILIALKSSVHWANIRGILYKLNIPNIKTTPQLVTNFANFPAPSLKLQQNIYSKYPSGTSKYSLLKKSFLKLQNFKYSKLIELSSEFIHPITWLFQLCTDIETDPIKYHLRSKTKQLCESPINLMDLSVTNKENIDVLFNLISIIVNVFANQGDEDELDQLILNSKIPKFEESSKNFPTLTTSLTSLKNKIEYYQLKNWNTDDIISRLIDEVNTENSIYSILTNLQA